MAAKRARKPRKGSRRVQAWVYGAINPLIDALNVELDLLHRGTVTWRHQKRGLEVIREPGDYLLGNGQIILDDLDSTMPEEVDPIHRHGERVREVEKTAAAAHDSVVQRSDFLPTVKQLAREHGTGFDAWNDGDYASLASCLAEYLVNGVRELGPEYGHADLWETAREPLRRMVAGADPFETLDEARERLESDAENLVRRLRELRTRLCEEYDIPAAPVAGVEAR